MSAITPTTYRAKSFDFASVLTALEHVGVSCKCNGQEIAADVDGTGHKSYKINPQKGVFFDASNGKKGTVASLLRRLGAQPAILAEPTPDAVAERAQDTSEAARRKWAQGWTCTHAGDMPVHWDKGLSTGQKVGVRARIERERDAAREYIRSRLGTDHLDHWVRMVRIGQGGMILAPMMRDGVLTGIQRTFLDRDGRKIERRMLGTKGILPLPAPVGALPLDLGIGDYTLIAEGFESDASVVQAAGKPGICVFDAVGIQKWAEDQAKKAASLPPEKLAKTKAAVFLVDRDTSETGQRACAYAVTTLRNAGLRAFFAMPPSPENGGPKGGPKSSDWGDYPREGISADVLRAHLALAVMRGDSDMAPYLPDENLAVVRSLWGVREAQTPRVPITPLPVEQARPSLTKLVDRFVEQAKRWQKSKGKLAEAPRLGLEISFGMGKSSTIKASIPTLKAQGIATVIVVKDHHEAEEYQAAGAWWRHGRADMTEQGGFDFPWHCPKVEIGAKLRESEHTQAAVLCGAGHCEHGNRRALRIADERGRFPPEHALQFFRELPQLQESASEYCWLDHQSESQRYTVIVVTAQGFGPQDAVLVHGDEKVQRVILVDEGVEWGHSAFARLDHLSKWLGTIKRLRDKDPNNTNLTKLSQVYETIGQELGTHAHTDGAYVNSPAIVEAVRSLGFAAAYRKEAVGTSGPWELPEWKQWTTLLDAPLRAAREIALASKTGAVSIVNGRLFLAYRHPIADLIADHAVLLADATLSPTAKAVLLQHKGEIYRIIGQQHMDLVCDPARFHAAPRRDSKHRILEDDIAPQIEEAQELLARHKAMYGPSYILLQKPKALRLLARVTGLPLKDVEALKKKSLWRMSIREGIGWWGWHDRAHNDWSGWHPVLFDQPAIERSVLGQQWETHRAIIGAEVPLPHYCGDQIPWVSGQWVCTGAQEQQSRAAIYQDPVVQEFFQAMIDSSRLQGLGRARALNQPADQPLHALICGGWPLAAATMHGLKIEYQAVSARRGREANNASRHEASMHRMDQAAARVVARGEIVTAASLGEEMLATGTDGAFYGHGYSTLSKPVETNSATITPFSYDTYQKWLARIREKAPALYAYMSNTGRGAAVVRAMRQALEQFGKTVLRVALEVTDAIVKQGDAVAWTVLDEAESNAALPEWQAIAMVLAAALGSDDTEDPPGFQQRF